MTLINSESFASNQIVQNMISKNAEADKKADEAKEAKKEEKAAKTEAKQAEAAQEEQETAKADSQRQQILQVQEKVSQKLEALVKDTSKQPATEEEAQALLNEAEAEADVDSFSLDNLQRLRDLSKKTQATLQDNKQQAQTNQEAQKTQQEETHKAELNKQQEQQTVKQEQVKQEEIKQQTQQQTAKAEATKTETVKQEQVKQETVNKEQVKQQDQQQTAKAETAKQDQLKAQAQQQTAKSELNKQEQVKQQTQQQTAKAELNKQEQVKQQTQQQTAKAELNKQEQVKQQTQQQTTKTEVAKQELLKQQDVAKQDSLKQQAQQQTAKAELNKQEQVKQQTQQQTAKTEVAKQEQVKQTGAESAKLTNSKDSPAATLSRSAQGAALPGAKTGAMASSFGSGSAAARLAAKAQEAKANAVQNSQQASTGDQSGNNQAGADKKMAPLPTDPRGQSLVRQRLGLSATTTTGSLSFAMAKANLEKEALPYNTVSPAAQGKSFVASTDKAAQEQRVQQALNNDMAAPAAKTAAQAPRAELIASAALKPSSFTGKAEKNNEPTAVQAPEAAETGETGTVTATRNSSTLPKSSFVNSFSAPTAAQVVLGAKNRPDQLPVGRVDGQSHREEYQPNTGNKNAADLPSKPLANPNAPLVPAATAKPTFTAQALDQLKNSPFREKSQTVKEENPTITPKVTFTPVFTPKSPAQIRTIDGINAPIHTVELDPQREGAVQIAGIIRPHRPGLAVPGTAAPHVGTSVPGPANGQTPTQTNPLTGHNPAPNTNSTTGKPTPTAPNGRVITGKATTPNEGAPTTSTSNRRTPTSTPATTSQGQSPAAATAPKPPVSGPLGRSIGTASNGASSNSGASTGASSGGASVGGFGTTAPKGVVGAAAQPLGRLQTNSAGLSGSAGHSTVASTGGAFFRPAAASSTVLQSLSAQALPSASPMSAASDETAAKAATSSFGTAGTSSSFERLSSFAATNSGAEAQTVTPDPAAPSPYTYKPNSAVATEAAVVNAEISRAPQATASNLANNAGPAAIAASASSAEAQATQKNREAATTALHSLSNLNVPVSALSLSEIKQRIALGVDFGGRPTTSQIPVCSGILDNLHEPQAKRSVDSSSTPIKMVLSGSVGVLRGQTYVPNQNNEPTVGERLLKNLLDNQQKEANRNSNKQAHTFNRVSTAARDNSLAGSLSGRNANTNNNTRQSEVKYGSTARTESARQAEQSGMKIVTEAEGRQQRQGSGQQGQNGGQGQRMLYLSTQDKLNMQRIYLSGSATDFMATMSKLDQDALGRTYAIATAAGTTPVTTMLKRLYRRQESNDLDEQEALNSAMLMLKMSGDSTYEHSTRTVEYAMDIADELGIKDQKMRRELELSAMFKDIGEAEIVFSKQPEEKLEAMSNYISSDDLRQASMLKDIGQTQLPASLVLEPEKLTEEEYRQLKMHPIYGEQMIYPIVSLRHLCPIIRAHHERWDGQGYPDGVQGEKIPLAARILAVTDAFEALTTERPFHAPVDVQKAKAILQQGVGTAFDPQCVEAFSKIIDRRYPQGGRRRNRTNRAAATSVASNPKDTLVSTSAPEVPAAKTKKPVFASHSSAPAFSRPFSAH